MKAKEKASPSSPLLQLLGSGKKKESSKKIKHKKTVITAHTNGSYTTQHSPDSPDEVSYASGDINGLKAGLDEHLGEGEAPPSEEAKK
ncbi:MAG: hypothetical protein ACYC7B_04535 [Burkholderiales bacterium]